MGKKIIIETCLDCPHSHTYEEIGEQPQLVCLEENQHVNYSDGTLIPDWCPLEDVKDE